MHELKNIHFVSITSDNWQSNSLNDYLGVTCHYIDKAFRMRSKVLCLSYMTEAKTADYLFKCLKSILIEFKIENKVISIILGLNLNIKDNNYHFFLNLNLKIYFYFLILVIINYN